MSAPSDGRENGSRVTVLVPCYNAAPYLPQMLASLDGQTTNGFDVVLVDDGSTDATLAIISDYATRHRCVTVIHQQDNRGVCHTLNDGLRHVSTEFTVVFAADDIMLPHLIHDALEAMDRIDGGVAVAFPHHVGEASGAVRCDGAGIEHVVYPPEGVELVEPPGLLPLLLVGNRFAGAAIFRTEAIRELGYDESLPIEDWDMWCRLAASHPIGVAPRPMFIYRDTPSSLDKHLKQSGQRYVTGARLRAKFVGGDGAIDSAVVARTKVELNILVTAGLREEAWEVLSTLRGAKLGAPFTFQRVMLRLPTRLVQIAAGARHRITKLREG